MTRIRTALVLAAALFAGVAPAGLGGVAVAAPPAPAVAEVGTVVQEGGRLTVPAGGEGPVTLRLKATLPAGVTGPVNADIGLPVVNYPPAGPNPRRLAVALHSTCSVNGGAFAVCEWDAPQADGIDYPYSVRLVLPVARAAATLTYAVTIDTSSQQSWVGSLDAPVTLRDSAGAVVAQGGAGLDFVPGVLPDPETMGVVHARDKAGVLWRYEGTSRVDRPFRPRKKIGGGWNAYTAIVPLGHATAAGQGDLVARDKAGILWYYKGTGNPDAPFAPRVRLGGGWNVYTAFTVSPRGELVGRDKAGVLWFHAWNRESEPFSIDSRLREGAGWNIYTTLNQFGWGALARDTSGVLWKYDAAIAEPTRIYQRRVRVGAGWNAYTSITTMRDVGGDREPDLVARDRTGKLWLYQSVIKNGVQVPSPTRTPVGLGWNIYDLMF
ncbi:tachylectin-related carbohydrate-binding protein [Streptomyces sp. NPDC017868]|uniref:tachylectin-related carbohydrate-binding protein n=1 Tax=Streptomyces sp. NPDC017868 TaxID=3365014 RepID=UPI0037B904F7